MRIAGWSNFTGANQRVHPKRLADGLGVLARNMRRGSADLRPLRAATTALVITFASTLTTIWRMGRDTPNDAADWLAWTGDVDVVRSLVASDPNEEIHYTEGGVAKTTDTAIGLPGSPGPASWRTLGIPAPDTTMIATAGTAGTADPETRVYLATFRNDKGRESAPGPATVITLPGGSTVDLTSLPTAPAGSHGINTRLIYVSTGGSDYQLCVEQASSATTASDTGARGNILQSGGDTSKPAWLVPPEGMAGLTQLWNGMLGAFKERTYMVCVPGKAWAWPVEYQETLPAKIVGTGKWLQNWVVLTTAGPYIVRGAGPLNMGYEAHQLQQGCLSKRSVVELGHGVSWASGNGLCYIGQQGASILTEEIFTPEQWQALAPSTMVCTRWERFILVWFNNGGTDKGFMIDPLAPSAGVVFITQPAQGVHYDPVADRLYLVDANTIKRWHNGADLTALWKSPTVRVPIEVNAGAGLVVSDEPVLTTVTLWANLLQADGARVWTQMFSRVVQSNREFAMPGGYNAYDFQAQIESAKPVQALLIGEDFEDVAS